MSVWGSEVIEVVPGQKIRCRGIIHKDLEVFRDHFPEFPVLPGVLALDILREAVQLCDAASETHKNGAQRLLSVQAVKFQHFLRPGEIWESQADLSAEDSARRWNVKLVVQSRTAVSAKLSFIHVESVREA